MVRLCIQGRTFQGKKNNKIGCVLSETQGSNKTLLTTVIKTRSLRWQQDYNKIVYVLLENNAFATMKENLQ